MKIKIAIIILAVACLGLGIALFTIKQQSEEQQAKDNDKITNLSDQVVKAQKQIDDLGQANLNYSNDLASANQKIELKAQELSMSAQQLAQLSNSLASAAATLTETRDSLTTAQGQITNLNSHIADLEAQNKVLDQRANDLTNTIAQLNVAIENSQNQLAIAETNRVFIEQELQKQLAKKAELEHKFNDLDEVRAQVKKLRDEMFIARRLQWMKNDNSQKKGAELLIQRNVLPTNGPAANRAPNYDLNVEIGSDGTVKVIPPLGATNAPAAR
jgi:chromosome segregation ATPase